jgi:protein-tyrosine phosphatase
VSEPAIRRGTAADADALVALRDEAAGWLVDRGIDQWRPGEVTRDDVLGWLAGGRVYVAERDGEKSTPDLVGAVRLAWSDQAVWGEQPADAGYLQALMTARRVAGQGLGRRLLAHAELVTARTGRGLTRLSCLRGNTGLERFYLAAGYLEVGERSFPTPGWAPVTLLEKRLSSPGS